MFVSLGVECRERCMVKEKRRERGEEYVSDSIKGQSVEAKGEEKGGN